MAEETRCRWQESDEEQRKLGVSFLQQALDILGLNPGVTDRVLDLVVKELLDHEGYHIISIPASEAEREESFDEHGGQGERLTQLKNLVR